MRSESKSSTQKTYFCAMEHNTLLLINCPACPYGFDAPSAITTCLLPP